MPSWKELLDEVRASGSTHDVIRRKYLRKLEEVTQRNVIVYYSGWLQKAELLQGKRGLEINDGDKNGFMAVVHGLDRTRGVDLILHTPGGDLAATESIIDYLRRMFDTNIRVIVPQLAMSGGTMIACAAKSIVLGKHSNLGPIDPQLGGVSAHAILDTWKEAKDDVSKTPALANVWAPVIAKYHPGLLQQCRLTIEWAKQIAKDYLKSGMLNGAPDAESKATAIVEQLTSQVSTKSHARHIHRDEVQSTGLVVEELEANQALQEAVLTVHHACIQTLTATPAFKLIENQNGVAFIQSIQQLLVAAP